jgi:hypothetical protein
MMLTGDGRAVRQLRVGEELFLDYGTDYFGEQTDGGVKKRKSRGRKKYR